MFPVGDHEAVEAPFAAEDVLHEEDVARGRDAVIVVEGGHQRERAGLHGRLERREVHIPQLAFRQERAVVVPTAFRGAVAGKMLDAGRHRRGVRQVALIAADHRLGHLGVQPGVLSASFRDAAPARVPRDVQHRREGPSDPLPGRLDGGHAGARLHEGGVEGRRQPQRDGENRVETVDDVPAHEERNPETGLLHADTLELIDFHRIHLVQDGSDLALAEGVGIVGRPPPRRRRPGSSGRSSRPGSSGKGAGPRGAPPRVKPPRWRACARRRRRSPPTGTPRKGCGLLSSFISA